MRIEVRQRVNSPAELSVAIAKKNVDCVARSVGQDHVESAVAVNVTESEGEAAGNALYPRAEVAMRLKRRITSSKQNRDRSTKRAAKTHHRRRKGCYDQVKMT